MINFHSFLCSSLNKFWSYHTKWFIMFTKKLFTRCVNALNSQSAVCRLKIYVGRKYSKKKIKIRRRSSMSDSCFLSQAGKDVVDANFPDVKWKNFTQIRLRLLLFAFFNCTLYSYRFRSLHYFLIHSQREAIQ